ncbi:hypothetical protein ACTXT7_001753 [Hymenolepis weldensis]
MLPMILGSTTLKKYAVDHSAWRGDVVIVINSITQIDHDRVSNTLFLKPLELEVRLCPGNPRTVSETLRGVLLTTHVLSSYSTPKSQELSNISFTSLLLISPSRPHGTWESKAPMK